MKGLFMIQLAGSQIQTKQKKTAQLQVIKLALPFKDYFAA